MRRHLLPTVALALLVVAGCASKHRDEPTPATSISLANGAFRLALGVEHDACGIGVVLDILPSSPISPKLDYPVLFGGPVGHVDWQVGDATGNDPLPDNAVHLQQAVVVTVEGKRFGVNSIDLEAKAAVLTPLC